MSEKPTIVYHVPEDGGRIDVAIRNTEGLPPGAYDADVEVRIIKRRPHKDDPPTLTPEDRERAAAHREERGSQWPKPEERYDGLG